MVQEKQPFSVLYVGCIKNLRAVFYWREQPQKETERMKRSYMVMQDVNYELFADSVEQSVLLVFRDLRLNW